MIFDKQNIFADKLALTTATGTNIIGDVIDLWAGATSQPNSALPQGINGPIGGPGAALVGRLDEVEVYLQVTTAVNSGGTATLQFQLVASAAAALTSPVVLGETPAYTITDATVLPQGTVVKITGDIGAVGGMQYLGLRQIVATAVLTAGAVTVGIVRDAQTLHA